MANKIRPLADKIRPNNLSEFVFLSAVAAGKGDLRKIIQMQEGQLALKPIIVFLDEIHRFNKAQQDYLLPYVENGTITLIGATTENPSFEVISPLLSRCQVFVLNPLTKGDLEKIIKKGISEFDIALTQISKNARDFLIEFANGDARQILNLLEIVYKLYGKITVSNLKQALQSKHLQFDKKDRRAYEGLRAAQEDVFKYGKRYEKYTKKDLLPKKLKGKKYFS